MKAYKLIVILAVFIAGCTMPATTTKSVDSRPSISITGAPGNSLLFIDGVNMGDANQYDGHPNVLMLESGTHTVSIVSNNQVIYEQTIFIESELKNIKVR